MCVLGVIVKSDARRVWRGDPEFAESLDRGLSLERQVGSEAKDAAGIELEPGVLADEGLSQVFDHVVRKPLAVIVVARSPLQVELKRLDG